MNETLLASPHKGSIECIESWHNEDYTQWYRVYSDGWCEQGGTILNNLTKDYKTVTLLKPYITVNYFVQASNNPPEVQWHNSVDIQIFNKTTNSFKITSNICDNNIIFYEAKGYIKD